MRNSDPRKKNLNEVLKTDPNENPVFERISEKERMLKNDSRPGEVMLKMKMMDHSGDRKSHSLQKEKNLSMTSNRL